MAFFDPRPLAVHAPTIWEYTVATSVPFASSCSELQRPPIENSIFIIQFFFFRTRLTRRILSNAKLLILPHMKYPLLAMIDPTLCQSARVNQASKFTLLRFPLIGFFEFNFQFWEKPLSKTYCSTPGVCGKVRVSCFSSSPDISFLRALAQADQKNSARLNLQFNAKLLT